MLAAPAAAALVLLHGAVTIGPSSPSCRAGTTCFAPAAHVTLVFSRSASIAMAQTDARGRYSVRLAAGTWTVRASRGLRVVPERVVVRPVATQSRNLVLDTLLR